MSVNIELPFRVVRTLHADGERRAYLVDKFGVEDDYSALFVIATFRKAGQSVALQEAALAAVNVLAAFCRNASIDLGKRFRSGKYLTAGECQALSDFAGRSFGAEAKRQEKVVALGKIRNGYSYVPKSVARQTYAARITYIAKFVDWLAKYLQTHVDEALLHRIKWMHDKLISYRGSFAPSRDDLDTSDFTEEDNVLLSNVILPGADLNPFSELVQLRNLLLIELIRQTGIRRGEALGIRIREDIDQVKRTIKVRRRHDSKDDPRKNGDSNAKTRGREIPVSIDMVVLISQYLEIRRKVPGARDHPFLFVTHKSGPTQGQPLTMAAAREAFKTIANAQDGLSHLTAHQLRHLFSSVLARVQQAEGSDQNTREAHRRVRNLVSGRNPDSEVDATYTQLETKRLAREAMLAVQAKLSPRLPRFGKDK